MSSRIQKISAGLLTIAMVFHCMPTLIYGVSAEANEKQQPTIVIGPTKKATEQSSQPTENGYADETPTQELTQQSSQPTENGQTDGTTTQEVTQQSSQPTENGQTDGALTQEVTQQSSQSTGNGQTDGTPTQETPSTTNTELTITEEETFEETFEETEESPFPCSGWVDQNGAVLYDRMDLSTDQKVNVSPYEELQLTGYGDAAETWYVT
ncbi:MAG: hypothetical protein PHI98_01170 [Eubacteriales bacterium]|nr:hypothetical protein [Eubacteriales bacterium]